MPILRFVHAADLHLDSPFTGLKSVAPQYVLDALSKATFSAYANIVELCITESVDALLIAGDIYDEADRSLRAQLKFAEGLRELSGAGIRSFICHGNHDPLSGWEARLDLPPECFRFGSEVQGAPVFPDDPKRAMVYGFSYPQREMHEDVTQQFAGLPPSTFNIGLLHANVGGNPYHDAYGACSIADLAEAPINYWALGHVHTKDVLRGSEPAIVYPGNPQGRHPNEVGVRGVYLVEVDEGGVLQLQFRTMDVIRWESRQLDISTWESEQTAWDAILSLAESLRGEAEGRPVVWRLELKGRGPLNRWLRHAETVEDILKQLNEEFASDEIWLWCERIQLNTAAPIDRAQVVLREDFVGDLARLADEIRNDATELASLRESLQVLYGANRARRHLRDLLPDDDELQTLLTAAEEECLVELVDDKEEA